MRIVIETVGDLIRELQKYPEYMRIFDESGYPFEEIRYVKEIPLGDSANPECKFAEGLKLI